MNLFSTKSEPIYRVEARGNPRVNERFPVTWHMKDRNIDGMARVRNISSTGMMIETNTDVALSENSVLAFELPKGNRAGFLPPVGRTVWSQKRGSISTRYLYGIEFVEPAQEILIKLREKIENKIAQLANSEKMKKHIGAVLFIVMAMLLAFYVVQQVIIQRNIEKSNDLMLASSRSQGNLYANVLNSYNVQSGVLEETARDLSATKAILVQTENMLTKAKSEVGSLHGEIAILKNKDIQALEARVGTLKANNINLKRELSITKKKIGMLAGDVKNVDEGRSAIVVHKKNIRDIKIKMRDLRRQAHLAKVAAQKELDRIALLSGNRGFIIKDSKPFKAAGSVAPKKKINISVTLVE